MNLDLKMAAAALIVLSGCGPAEFAGTSFSEKSSEAGDAGGTVAQAGEDEDEADGLLRQVSVDEFVGMLPGQPTDVNELRDVPGEVGQIAKQTRCYISGGGGHGVDVCLPGDKTAISRLQPIEIRGDQLCVPVATLAENAALFARGMMGLCEPETDTD